MLGEKIKSIYGREKPTDIIRNIAIIVNESPNIANPTAVPKKGALQGVANSVAKDPLKKSLYFLFLLIQSIRLLLNELGSIISKNPNIFSVKIRIIMVTNTKNKDFENENPNQCLGRRISKVLQSLPTTEKSQLYP